MGISAIENASAEASTTVRLTPSTATEPFGTIWAASGVRTRSVGPA